MIYHCQKPIQNSEATQTSEMELSGENRYLFLQIDLS